MIDINEIRKLCDKATPGPWDDKVTAVYKDRTAIRICGDFHDFESDAMFVAQSREIIPALLDELEAAQNTQRWIPVTERLPKDDETVYVYCPTGRGSVEATVGMMARAHKYTGYTHWMPRIVPDPPKGE